MNLSFEEYKKRYYGELGGKLIPKLGAVPESREFSSEYIVPEKFESYNWLPTIWPAIIVSSLTDRSLVDDLQRHYVKFLTHLISLTNDVLVTDNPNPFMSLNPTHSQEHLFWSHPDNLVNIILDGIDSGVRMIAVELIYKTQNAYHQNMVFISILYEDQTKVTIERFDPNGWSSRTFWNDGFDLYFTEFVFDAIDLVNQIDPDIEIILSSPFDGCPYLGPQARLKCEEWINRVNIWSDIQLGFCSLWSLVYGYLKLLPENWDRTPDQIFNHFYLDFDYSKDRVCQVLIGFLEYGLVWLAEHA